MQLEGKRRREGKNLSIYSLMEKVHVLDNLDSTRSFQTCYFISPFSMVAAVDKCRRFTVQRLKMRMNGTLLSSFVNNAPGDPLRYVNIYPAFYAIFSLSHGVSEPFLSHHRHRSRNTHHPPPPPAHLGTRLPPPTALQRLLIKGRTRPVDDRRNASSPDIQNPA